MELQKGSESRPGVSRRRYDDACGTAHALDLVGERWALLVMRELMLGPKRFSDIRADLPGISANVLTQRLEGLEASGLLVRRRLPPPASAQVYELTEWGYEAEPIFCELGRWAARSPAHDPTLPLSGTSLMLSFRTMFDPARARGMKARIGLRIGAESFVVTIAGGRLESGRGDVEGADLVLTGPATAVAAAVYGGVPLEALEAEGALGVDGDRALAERFVTLFPLPSKIGAAS
jgi:DNA-binding HxlR family transcriptional regulator